MRSLMHTTSHLKTVALAALLTAVPLAGAYAAHHTGSLRPHRVVTVKDVQLNNLIDQVQGLDDGITDASQQKLITPATARDLHMDAASIMTTAEREAAQDHGTLPTGEYDQLLRRLDNLAQTRLFDSGSGLDFSGGGDGGSYPNG